MTERYTVIPRTLCFIFHEDEILLIKASPKKEWAGYHNALGGHIEQGENVVDSANREIMEETGLNVEDTKIRGIVNISGFFGKEVVMFVTASTAATKEVISNDEGELIWVKKDALENFKIFEDVKPMLDLIIKMKGSEMFVGTSEFDGNGGLVKMDFKVC